MPGSRDDAKKSAACDSQCERECAKSHRDGKSLREDLGDTSISILRRVTQISAHQIAQIACVLLPKRTVQLIFGKQLLLDRRRNFPLGVKWSTGGKANQKERDCDHTEQHGHQRNQATDEESDHALSSMLSACPCQAPDCPCSGRVPTAERVSPGGGDAAATESRFQRSPRFLLRCPWALPQAKTELRRWRRKEPTEERQREPMALKD